MYTRVFILLLVFIFSMNSCQKDELTLPAKVYFTFGLEPLQESGLKNQSTESDANPPFGQLDIDMGAMVVRAIEFDGKREQGRDVYFISDFDAPLQIMLGKHEDNVEVSFDIPQGSYKKIDIGFHLGDFNGTGLPSLTLEGNMVLPNSQSVYLRFEYHFDDIIVVRSRGSVANENILLRKDKVSTATVEIDVPFLFRFINMGELMSGQFAHENGNEVLVINEHKNQALFNKLANRLNNAFSVVIQ